MKSIFTTIIRYFLALFVVINILVLPITMKVAIAQTQKVSFYRQLQLTGEARFLPFFSDLIVCPGAFLNHPTFTGGFNGTVSIANLQNVTLYLDLQVLPRLQFDESMEMDMFLSVNGVSVVNTHFQARNIGGQYEGNIGAFHYEIPLNGDSFAITCNSSGQGVFFPLTSPGAPSEANWSWRMSLMAEPRANSKIESVVLENLDGTLLDVNPTLNNEFTLNGQTYGGGVRFFPDATSPTGQPQKVKVKAKVTPIQANVPVYFRSFDVDDSSGLFSNASHTGQDNQGTKVRNDGIPIEGKFDGFNVGAIVSAMTGADGIASVDFIVTMQPGDNFKIVATTNQSLVTVPGSLTVFGQEILNSTSGNIPLSKQPDPNEPSITPAEAVTSQLLTVWRYLHVEMDSMLAPPVSPAGDSDPQRNYIKGDIIGINISSNNVQFFFVNQLLRDGSKDIDFPSNMGFGRFQGGQLTIGTSVITISNISGNGGQFIAKSTITRIPCQLTDKKGNTISVFIEQMINGSTTSKTPDMFILSQPVNSPGQYNGGSLTVAGKTFIIDKVKTNNVELDSNVTQPPFSLPFFLKDDDQTVAPTLSKMTHFSLMQNSDLPSDNKFAKAYIKPIYDLVNVPKTPLFMRNLPTPNNSATNLIQQAQSGREQASISSLNYWVAYFQGAFQTDSSEDLDPDNEPPSLGQTPFDRLSTGRFNYGCLIYFETCRDYSSVCAGANFPVVTEQKVLATTVLHEAGHLFDLQENSGLIMNGSTPCNDSGWSNLSFAIFSDAHLKMIRTTKNP